jgi:hypothetical protein
MELRVAPWDFKNGRRPGTAGAANREEEDQMRKSWTIGLLAALALPLAGCGNLARPGQALWPYGWNNGTDMPPVSAPAPTPATMSEGTAPGTALGAS